MRHAGNFKKGQHSSPKTEFKKGIDIGENSPNWKGGRSNNGSGYITIATPIGHPCKRYRIFEHRFVMEKHLGRFLDSREIVHHINGIRNDNRIENLQLMESSSIHIKHHYPYNTNTQRKCSSCKTIYPLNAENFFRDKNLLHGLEYRCKKCAIEKDIKYLAKKKFFSH